MGKIGCRLIRIGCRSRIDTGGQDRYRTSRIGCMLSRLGHRRSRIDCRTSRTCCRRRHIGCVISRIG